MVGWWACTLHPLCSATAFVPSINTCCANQLCRGIATQCNMLDSCVQTSQIAWSMHVVDPVLRKGTRAMLLDACTAENPHRTDSCQQLCQTQLSSVCTKARSQRKHLHQKTPLAACVNANMYMGICMRSSLIAHGPTLSSFLGWDKVGVSS